jgi:hypothetical protein
MSESIDAGRTTTLADIDIGNLAPLLVNYLAASRGGLGVSQGEPPPLPWQRHASADMPEAGLYVRATPRYYAILGASNGGVLKVFDTVEGAILCDDGGYVGALSDGTLVSTQVTDLATPTRVTAHEIEVTASCCDMLQAVPTPWTGLALRLASLTVMRVQWPAELIKRALARLLITGVRRRPVQVRRLVRFDPESVFVHDEITRSGRVTLSWLQSGRRFVSIHMASAKYFDGARPAASRGGAAPDVEAFNRTGRLVVETTIGA